MRINSPSPFRREGICTGNESFFLYYCLPLGLGKEKGHKRKFSGIKGDKKTWLGYYIHDEFVPRNSTGRCHGDDQKLQQIPSWIPSKFGSIWSPLAWRYRLQRERHLSSSGIRGET